MNKTKNIKPVKPHTTPSACTANNSKLGSVGGSHGRQKLLDGQTVGVTFGPQASACTCTVKKTMAEMETTKAKINNLIFDFGLIIF